MTDVNRFDLRRDIPSAIKRAVRQRDGFGCIGCGSALIDYEHLEPEFKDAHEHLVEGIVLLCPKCHRQKGGFLSRETIAEWARNPFCKRAGFASGPFDFGDKFPEIVLGTLRARNVPVLLRVLGEDIFSILPPEEAGAPFRLSALLRDVSGTETLKIVENEWQIPSHAWDAVVEGKRITIRRAYGEIALVLRSEPPERIVIERLEMSHKGLLLSCREGQSLTVSVNGRILVADEAVMEGCRVGIEVEPERLLMGRGGFMRIGRMKIDSVGQISNRPLSVGLPGSGKVRRNAPCPCGSGLKFKKCHGLW